MFKKQFIGVLLLSIFILPGCDSESDNNEIAPLLTQCNDGIDNDLDALIDYPSDPDCDSASDNSEIPPLLTQCNDGLIDSPSDPDCDSISGNSEIPPLLTQCNDGIDNDFDGLIDSPSDPGCSTINDTDETNGIIILGNTLRVPQEYSTIQSAINSAQDGDLVLVSPGTYREQLTINGKTITLASEFFTTQNRERIRDTIIDGNGRTALTTSSSVGPETAIIGFTLTNANDGIRQTGYLHVLNNYFTQIKDAIDYESGSKGTCRNNVFEGNYDDAIDLDFDSEILIEHNTIINNGDDGIEIRLHSYNGPTLNIIIRNNFISGNGEDGIQLIDYPGFSDRVFHIYNNQIINNGMAGIGMMADGDTIEDYSAASIPEPMFIYNNHIIENNHGITGGDNVFVKNNIFAGTLNIAIKNIDGNSQLSNNLFWNNGVDNSGSNEDSINGINANPLLDENLSLQVGSPAIDAGETILEITDDFLGTVRPQGSAYDIGAFEYISGEPSVTNTQKD